MKKKILIFTLLLIGLAACNNNDDAIRFRALNEGLKQYANTIKESNKLIEDKLREKLQHPATATGARTWLVKAVYIQALADSTCDYIDSLKAKLRDEAGVTGGDTTISNEKGKDAVRKLFKKEGSAAILNAKLVELNEKMLAILNPNEFGDNVLLKEDIKRTKAQFRKQLPVNRELPLAAYFNNAGIPAALAMLSKLQNDVGITANCLINYCNSNVSNLRRCEAYVPIVVQSSKFLKAGQLLEITAVIEPNNETYDPKISIDGKYIPLDADGIVIYRLKAPVKPGKYFVPVRVDITKPDSSKASISKKMEYTVEE